MYQRYHEDSGSHRFRKLVLSWEIAELDEQKYNLASLPRALESEEITTYYRNFLPFILEESRAILLQGLRTPTPTFPVAIVSLNKYRNPSFPVNLQLKGVLPKDSVTGTACIALQLTYNDRNRTSLLCLADVEPQDNFIYAKLLLHSESESYNYFISTFLEQYPDALEPDTPKTRFRWTAQALGSLLPQMRMYEACYDPYQPSFIRELVTGNLHYQAQDIPPPFHALTVAQQQAIQTFDNLTTKEQNLVKNFLSLDARTQVLIQSYHSLPPQKQQPVKFFFTLPAKEQQLVPKLYALSSEARHNVYPFSVLDPVKQQAIHPFLDFAPSRLATLNAFLNAQDREAINYYMSRDIETQAVAREFLTLSSIEYETISIFYTLTPTEQVTIENLQLLTKSHEELLQKAGSFFSSIRKFFSGKSGYEEELAQLEIRILEVIKTLNPTQHQAYRLFENLGPTTQKSIYKYLAPQFSHKAMIQTLLQFDAQQKKALQAFAALPITNQKDIQLYYSLDAPCQELCALFFKLQLLEQNAIRGLHSLTKEGQDNVKYFFDRPQLAELIQPFAESQAILAQVVTYLYFNAQQIAALQKFKASGPSLIGAINYFYALSPRNKIIYNAFITLNHSQQTAIRNFYRFPSGLQILQGPPGTGKTTTLVELLHFLCLQNKRSLVCAPSNKAVQVIAEKFLAKYPMHSSMLVGVEEKLKDSLRPIFVHTWGNDTCLQIRHLVNIIARYLEQDQSRSPQQINTLLQPLITKIQLYTPDLFQESITALEHAINYAALENIQSQLLSLKENIATIDANDLEIALLDNAKIIFVTLSSSGRRIFNDIIEPDILIIDEASQAVEPETLIPLGLKPNKCLLVGDTKQLPATVISQIALNYNYNWSMMWRLTEECGQPCDMLTVQYRMHPEIRRWPSQQYYENLLEDDPGIVRRPLSQSQYGTYAFIDVISQELLRHSSYYNPAECTQIIAILRDLATKGINVRQQVSIITFYAAQVTYIQQELQKTSQFANVKVHTVDSYQGSEQDYIIISFVRSNPGNAIGFLHDFRRLNVAITRAKLALLMVGNAKTLTKHKQHDVAKLVSDARIRQRLFAPQPRQSSAPAATRKPRLTMARSSSNTPPAPKP